MNRSSWKLPYLANSFFRLLIKTSSKPYLVWSRNSTFLLPFLGKTLKIYNGKKFVSLQVKRSFLGFYSGDFCMSKLLGKKIHQRKKKKLIIKDKMGHLVNPTGVRLGYSLSWSESWNASNKMHYYNYYSNMLLVRMYTNYYFSTEYIESLGIFFSHFSVYWSAQKFIIEINLYDGRIEDWIESCINLFSKDFKRLASYALRTFNQNSRSAEFSRSYDLQLFRFLTLLVFKLLFKTSPDVIENAYFLNSKKKSNLKLSKFLFKLVNFLVLKTNNEDLI